jgi:hypothetical protein
MQISGSEGAGLPLPVYGPKITGSCLSMRCAAWIGGIRRTNPPVAAVPYMLKIFHIEESVCPKTKTG